jgi:hypothetical protein
MKKRKKSATLISRLRITCILHIAFVNKTTFKLALRANPINNEISTSLFIGLALSESLNVVLFYTCNVQIA